MRVELIDDATDQAETYEVSSLSKEKDGLRIGTHQGMILIIDPFDEVAEAVVELVGRPSLPELRRPQRVHSMQELLAGLAQLQKEHPPT